jgi:hypothetical protein
MKAAVLKRPGEISIEERPVPKPVEGEVLVRVRASGICGSDIHGFQGKIPERRPPGIVMGHEAAGEVAEAGARAGGFKAGDRVVINPLIPCGECYSCSRGWFHLCDAMVNLEMRSGALGNMCASFAADDLSASPWAYTIKAIGTEGSTSYSYNDWVEAKKGISHSRTYTALQSTFDNEVRQFIRSVRYGERPPSTLEDAILCQRMIEAIETSIAEGRAVDV